ncbi:Homoserine/homoserine lactone efflux protein [Falsiruegeria litorea R37]|uniref:Homoserine/homoserine lactone efflux protein n=1 Tax=Falsiruegeria litorea R37 TaxID=1200284 RepID=A0A1Y5T3D6_9RHOB|nr:Homoserine/homoserine lactone efflux protein [Falsiruegeria litorea R37]
MPLDLWLAFAAASTALLLIPGPTVLLVLSYALSKGRPVAVASATGVALGDLIAMTASLAGLGALVLASATLFTVLKWVGAAYLLWLGFKLLRSAPSQGMGTVANGKDVTPRSVFMHAAAVTSLNPKSIAFFYRLCSAVPSPGRAIAAAIHNSDRNVCWARRFQRVGLCVAGRQAAPVDRPPVGDHWSDPHGRRHADGNGAGHGLPAPTGLGS